VLAAQLDLFADRHVRTENARRALAQGRAEDACRELDQLRRNYPDDAAIAAELAHVSTLLARVGEIEAAPADDRPAALLELARIAAVPARPWLLRRAATALCDAWGPAGLVDDKPASVLLLEAGDLHTAWSVAAQAVAGSPRARFLAYLADVEHRLDQRSRSRARYREALAVDPFDVDWDEIAAEEVKALPEVAVTELELDDGVAWAAPVGVVMKVLPLGDPPPPCMPDEAIADAGRRAALQRSRDFLRALVQASQARDASAIDARRQMRALAPQLLAAYLESR
jgi:hypothetical protein